MQFRWRAMLAVGIAAVPLFSLAVFFANERKDDEFARAALLASAVARTLADEQTRIFVHARQLVAALALGNDALDDTLLGPDCDREALRIIKTNPLYFQIGVADADGAVRCSAVPVKPDARVAERRYFIDAKATNEVVLSGVLLGRDSGKHTVIAAQALRDKSDRVLGVLFAAIDLGWLQPQFERAGLPAASLAVLVDGMGTIIAEVGPEARFRGQRVLDAEAVRNGQAVGAVRIVPWLDGMDRITVYAPVSGVPGESLYMRVGVPIGVVHEAGRRVLYEGLGLVALVLAAALLAAWFGSDRFIVRPLRLLGEAAGRIGKGDYSARTGIEYRGEIGAVAQKLDELAASNQRVNRALRTLSAGNRTLLREKSEDALLHAMCQVAVTHGGYRLALVNYAMHDEAKSMVTKAHAGHSDGFVESINASWADAERGRGTVGSAIRSGKAEVIRSIARDPRAAPWRAAMLSRGYASAMSLPLQVEGSVIGTLTLVAPDEDAFDDGEVALLDEMAADLSFGIETVRLNLRRVAAEEVAKNAALRDALTGLPNRTRFLELLEHELAAAAAAEVSEPLAVVVVHLPGLQRMYNALGHDLLNEVFAEIAGRLGRSRFNQNCLARVQDNDFALLHRQTDAERASAVADELLRAFELPVTIDGTPIEVRACIGTAFFPGHGKEAEILLRRAAIASRDAAKKDLSFHTYRGMKERENVADLALVAELRNAIESRTLMLHYQPKILLASGAVKGSEALIRWQHPAKGMVPPVQFVPLAEQTGLIRPLTYFVIEAAVRQARAWSDAGLALPVAVNLSARSLYDPKLLERMETIVATWGIDPKLLEIEITEGALVEDTQGARAVLERLSSLFGRIYIDDFGTGYSSLSYLVSLPVHALKIDRAFVIQMTKSREARSVVESVISMAHALGLIVVAEGVETAEDAAILRELGCDEAQGYFFGKPVPPADFATAALRGR